MKKNKDLMRCTNCWEGFDWEENPPGDLSGECPGKLDMVDDKGIDEKILAVAVHDPRYHRIDDLENIEPHVLKEIEQFFSVYKTLEGKLSLTFGWSGKSEALRRIDACRLG